MKGGTLSYFTIDGDFSSVGIHNIFDDFRAESGSPYFGADSLFREKTFSDLLGHALACIFN